MLHASVRHVPYMRTCRLFISHSGMSVPSLLFVHVLCRIKSAPAYRRLFQLCSKAGIPVQAHFSFDCSSLVTSPWASSNRKRSGTKIDIAVLLTQPETLDMLTATEQHKLRSIPTTMKTLTNANYRKYHSMPCQAADIPYEPLFTACRSCTA